MTTRAAIRACDRRHGQQEQHTSAPDPGHHREAAQILRGKLNRSHQGLARDAFNLIAAAKADPKALQHAVNALDKSETDVVRANLEDANDDIADRAEDALMGIGRGFERDTSRLGLDAAQAVDNSRYERVRIALDGDKLTIKRWTAKRKERPETHTAEQVANALLESGIGEYLKANHELHETMAGQGIAELQRQRRQGPTRRDGDRPFSAVAVQVVEQSPAPRSRGCTRGARRSDHRTDHHPAGTVN